MGKKKLMTQAKSFLKSAALGLAAGQVAAMVANKVAPQYSGIAQVAGAGIVGGGSGLVAQFLVGGVPQLGGTQQNGGIDVI